MKNEFKNDIDIDPEALDVEWLRQPRLMGDWCERRADARAEADRAKERRDVVYAELDREVRMEPEKFGLEKITESAVSNAIKLDARYREAFEEHIEATHAAEVCDAAVRAFDHKKTALETLVRLHGQQYFAGPSVPRDLAEEARNLIDDQRREGVAGNMRKKMKKRRRRD